ncbi:uncharacterized protein LOC135149261 [Daucus carota subsp. sativus]|uniref:uncharacterized protein LOC135149261 n=1 Tax=Daucus carota subsp. sativus TaxID=79200 RepID=UPI0030832015
MASDRSWITRSRYNESRYLTDEYKNGVEDFIRFACENLSGGVIRCPCGNCKNKHYKTPTAVKLDLYRYGMMQWYTIWTAHGEKMPEEKIETSTRNVGDGDDDMYHDADDMLRDIGEANRYFENVDDEPNPAAKEFYKMLHSASEPIYPSNVNYTTFEFVNELLHFKNKHNCSNNGFDDLLKLIGLVLPDNHKLPQTYYAVKNMLKGLNLGYEKIDACENDCMLFYKENSEKTRCDICKESRYKEPKDLNKKKISRKILRYFPLTPRLQRLFMAGKTAKCMRWHHDRNVVEGELSHPADGDEWKQFDRRFPKFSKERFEM